MNFIRKFQTAAVAIAAALLAATAFGQAYPINNPTYIPTAILASQTFTGANTATFNTNGNATLYLRVGGTNTSLSATVGVTESRATSPTFTTVSVQTVGGPRIQTIKSTGLYRLNVAGAAQVKFTLASLVGTNVTVAFSASPGPQFVESLPATRQTYGAFATFTPAATPMEFYRIAGSASSTIRVTRAECSGSSTSTSSSTISLVKRSTLSSGGTSAAATVAAFDSNNTSPAAAAVLSFTANPSLGATVGALRSALIGFAPTQSAVAATPVVWNFGLNPGEQEIVLRGAAQSVGFYGNGVSFAGAPALTCGFTWTED